MDHASFIIYSVDQLPAAIHSEEQINNDPAAAKRNTNVDYEYTT